MKVLWNAKKVDTRHLIKEFENGWERIIYNGVKKFELRFVSNQFPIVYDMEMKGR